MNETIILTLAPHPLWGYILQPAVVAIQQEGWLTILETAGSKCPVLSDMNETSREIVRLSCNYSDKTLMKSFSKEKNTTDFYKKVSLETINNQIRPCIESNQKKILQLLNESGMPIYMRKSIKDRTLHDLERISISEGFATAIFYFAKDSESGLKYYIRVKEGDQEEIDLFGKTFYIVCTEPAVFVIDKLMLIFRDIDANKLLPFFAKSHIEVPESSEARYIKSFVLNCLVNYSVKTEGLNIRKVEPKKSAMLTLENDINSEAILTLAFLYDKTIVPMDHPDKKIVLVNESGDEVSLSWFYPDKAWETNQIKKLLENGLVQNGLGNFSLRNKQDSEAKNEYLPTMREWIKEHDDLLRNFVMSQSLPYRAGSKKNLH